MGCAASRPGKINSELGSDCNELMTTNLNLLRILECLHIQNQKLSSALYTLYIKKQTEQHYKIIKNYRNFWLSDAKSSTSESQLLKKLEICEIEQLRERTQLTFCKNTLIKAISDIYPEWHKCYKSISDFLEDLEISPSITQVSSTLYRDFYLASNKEIKEGLAELPRIPASDKKVFKLLKSVAIGPYKSQKDCVYFTDKIVITPIKKKGIQSVPASPLSKNEFKTFSCQKASRIKDLNLEQSENSHGDSFQFPRLLLNQRSSSFQQELVESVSNEKPEQEIESSLSKRSSCAEEDMQRTKVSRKISNLSSVDSQINTKSEVFKASEINSEKSSSNYNSEEDEEYLARLSYSQK